MAFFLKYRAIYQFSKEKQHSVAHMAVCCFIKCYAVLCLPLFFSRKRLVAFGITLLLVGLIFFSYATGGVKIADADRSKPTFRLLQSNLRYDNATPSKLLAFIQHYHPDIITVQEVSPQWLSFFHENGLTTIT